MNSNSIICIILGLNTFGILILAILIFRFKKNYNRILSGVKGDNLEKVLKSHIERVDKAVEQNVKIEQEFSEFLNFSQKFLYRIGFQRFNPFQNTGGDQSFAVSILDDAGDGIVISSMHAREGTRIYAKPVKGGKEGKYKFSKEETDVINKALQ